MKLYGSIAALLILALGPDSAMAQYHTDRGAVLGGLGGALAGAALASEPIDVGHAKQLFIDGRFIQSSEDVTLTMNPPVKQPHEDVDALLARPENAELDYGPIFYDPSAPPEQRWKKVLRQGHMRERETAGLYIYYSADRINWVAVPERVFPYWPDGESSMMYDPALGKYVAYFRQWVERDPGKPYFDADPLPLRTVGRLVVDDPLKPWVDGWPDQPTLVWGPDNLPAPGVEFDVALACDEQDPPECDFYYHGIVRYPWADDVYLAFPVLYRHFPDEFGDRKNDGLADVQLATSRDGMHWRRFRGSYIRLGSEGSPDSAGIYNQRSLVRDGNKLRQYYSGRSQSHAAIGKLKTAAVPSMTVQRLDGFVSADAAYGGGELTTPLIVFDGDRLELNIDTSAVGDARVEILGGDGRAVPGFSLADADMMQGNFIRRTVTWAGSDDVSTLKGQPIRLRFVMREAKLYAFQFMQDEHQVQKGDGK